MNSLLCDLCVSLALLLALSVPVIYALRRRSQFASIMRVVENVHRVQFSLRPRFSEDVVCISLDGILIYEYSLLSGMQAAPGTPLELIHSEFQRRYVVSQ